MVIPAGPKLIVKLKCDYEGWTVTTVLLLYGQELETITGRYYKLFHSVSASCSPGIHGHPWGKMVFPV